MPTSPDPTIRTYSPQRRCGEHVSLAPTRPYQIAIDARAEPFRRLLSHGGALMGDSVNVNLRHLPADLWRRLRIEPVRRDVPMAVLAGEASRLRLAEHEGTATATLLQEAP